MNDKIQEYLEMDDEYLYEFLGQAAVDEQGLQGFESLKDKLNLGKQIFEEYKKQFRNLICSNKKLLKAIQSEELNTSFNIASLIVPLISSAVIPGTAVLVAVLLIKYGITKYCEVI